MCVWGHIHPRESLQGKVEKFSCIVKVTITRSFSFTFLMVPFVLVIVVTGSEMLTADTKNFIYTVLVYFSADS